MVFENGVKDIQAAAYNGARTVLSTLFLAQGNFLKNVDKSILYFYSDSYLYRWVSI